MWAMEGSSDGGCETQSSERESSHAGDMASAVYG